MRCIIVAIAAVLFTQMSLSRGMEYLRLAVVCIIGICFCFYGVSDKFRKFLGTFAALTVFRSVLINLYNILNSNPYNCLDDELMRSGDIYSQIDNIDLTYGGLMFNVEYQTYDLNNLIFDIRTLPETIGILPIFIVFIAILILNRYYKLSTRFYSFTITVSAVLCALEPLQDYLERSSMNNDRQITKFDDVDSVLFFAAALLVGVFIAFLGNRKHPVLFIIISSSVFGAMMIGHEIFVFIDKKSSYIMHDLYEYTVKKYTIYTIALIASVLIFGTIGFFVQRALAKKLPICDGSDSFLALIRNSEKVRKEMKRAYKEGKYTASATAAQMLVEFDEHLLSNWRNIRRDNLVVYLRRLLHDFSYLMDCYYLMVNDSTPPIDRSLFFHEEFNGFKFRVDDNIMKAISAKGDDKINRKIDCNYTMYRGFFTVELSLIFCRFSLKFPGVFSKRRIEESYENGVEILMAADSYINKSKFNSMENPKIVAAPSKQTMKWLRLMKKEYEQLKFSVYTAGN